MADRRRRRAPAPQAQHDEAPKKQESLLSLVLWAALIAFFFKSFLLDTFWIPSASMEPTMVAGDFIVVTKWTYGYNRHSLVFDPPIFRGQRLWGSTPKRGDIVVFDSTTHENAQGPRRELENGGYHVIKRVVGLPGDHVEIKDGLIHITQASGEQLVFERELLEENANVEIPCEGTVCPRANEFIYQETNPEGVSYRVREYTSLTGAPFGQAGDNYTMGEFVQGDPANRQYFPGGVVPEGHVFVMGDNRDQSGDSRFSVRSLPLYKVVGKARLIAFSFSREWYRRFFRLLG